MHTKRKLQNATPLGTYYTQSSKGLVTRGLLEPKPIVKNGKTHMAFFITPMGIQLLEESKLN